MAKDGMRWGQVLEWSAPAPERYRLKGRGQDGRARTDDWRLVWASPARNDVPVEQWTYGEVQARRMFSTLVCQGRDAVAAVRVALDVDSGPVAGQMSLEQWGSYWSPAVLHDVAQRWLSHPGMVDQMRMRTQTAVQVIRGAAHLAAELLTSFIADPLINPNVRARCAVEVLDRAGVMAQSQGAAIVEELKQRLREKARQNMKTGRKHKAMADPDTVTVSAGDEQSAEMTEPYATPIEGERDR